LLIRERSHAALTGRIRAAGQIPDARRLESGHDAPACRSHAVSRIDARVQVVDTESGRTFTERFDATPIRIGRALDSDLVLPHPTIAARHGEIAIGARAATFRRRARLRVSYVDGARVKRGRAVKLADESIISVGPYEVRVWFRVRDRSYERERKVTPLACRFQYLDGASRGVVFESSAGDRAGGDGDAGGMQPHRITVPAPNDDGRKSGREPDPRGRIPGPDGGGRANRWAHLG
jgi:hypothetical protein